MRRMTWVVIILSGCTAVDVGIENAHIIKQKDMCIDAGMDYQIATNYGKRQAYCTKKEGP